MSVPIDERKKYYKSCPGWAITKDWIFSELDPVKAKLIKETELILADRMDEAWAKLDEANAAKRYLHELKGTEEKLYTIIEEK